MNGTIYVQFGAAEKPTFTVGAASGAFAVDPWKGAAADAEWLAEQQQFADMASVADRESISQEA